MADRRFPIWPGIALAAGALLCASIACSIFHHAKQADIDAIAASITVHNHALEVYNSRCRPAASADALPSCQKFLIALKNQESATAAALKYVGVGKADLQMSDLNAATDLLRKLER